jgi:predicted dienelactone hydrolase
MAEYTVSRRQFLAVAGLGATAAALGACGINASTTLLAPSATPNPSPAAPGPYQVGEVILGEDDVALYDALSQFMTLGGDPGFPSNFLVDDNRCADGTLVGPQLPPNIHAAVYYPSAAGAGTPIPTLPIATISSQSLTANPLSIAKGPFPVMLYAHAYRDPLGSACGGAHPSTRDFTSVGDMLRHVASYGCVVVVPDLSWIPGGFNPATFDYYKYGIVLRAQVLMRYYDRLMSLNGRLFAQQLDLSRLIMAGHSTGGPSAVEAARLLSFDFQFGSLSYGLLAPIPGVLYGAKSNLLVLKGGNDLLQGADPAAAYAGGGLPRTLVTIPGANHFGYSDICPENNHCAGVISDTNADIGRALQQLAGASYLAALVRYYARGDATTRPYLSGEKQVEGLVIPGASIQVQSQGL